MRDDTPGLLDSRRKYVADDSLTPEATHTDGLALLPVGGAGKPSPGQTGRARAGHLHLHQGSGTYAASLNAEIRGAGVLAAQEEQGKQAIAVVKFFHPVYEAYVILRIDTPLRLMSLTPYVFRLARRVRRP